MTMTTYVYKAGKKAALELLILVCVFIMGVFLLSVVPRMDFVYSDGRIHSTLSVEQMVEISTETVKTLWKGDVWHIFLEGVDRHKTIGELLKGALKNSSVLFIGAFLLALILGMAKGIFDSRRKRGSTLKILSTLMPLSVPDVLLIVIIQSIGVYLYSKNFRFFGLGPIRYVGSGHWTQAIYPTMAIASVAAAYVARITTVAIEEVYTREYILTARGKGCSELRIIMVHTMKHVLSKILAAFPSIISILFASLIITERIFAYKGIGFHFFDLNFRVIGSPVEEKMAFMVFTLALIMIYYLFLNIAKIISAVVWNE